MLPGAVADGDEVDRPASRFSNAHGEEIIDLSGDTVSDFSGGPSGAAGSSKVGPNTSRSHAAKNKPSVDAMKRSNERRQTDPAAQNYFDGRDAGRMHVRHDRSLHKVLRGMSGSSVDEEGFAENIVSALEFQKLGSGAGRIYGGMQALQHVEEQRMSSKKSYRPDLTKRSPEGAAGIPEDLCAQVPNKDTLGRNDWLLAAFISLCSLTVVLVVCIWSQEGLMDSDHMGHHFTLKTRQGHMSSAIYRTPVLINLPGTQTEFFEVRLIGMSSQDFAASHASHHRRLSPGHNVPRLLASSPPTEAVTGNLTYKLYHCNTQFYEKTIEFFHDDEVEDFQDIDVAAELRKGALADRPGLGRSDCTKEYFASVTSNRSDEHESAFLLQVVRMNSSGRYRQVIGVVIFIITFIGIVSEKIHRSYSVFLGASCTLCTLAAIQETPHLSTIAGMIDWGTLMLLFSMMILMGMLAVTGFFNWFAVKVVMLSKQNTKVLFFFLTNICGLLSMVLDNVTCVMLVGPLTYSLSKKMGLNPRPLYLSMTICATIGGTATLIGDPPNIVIGSKLGIGFEKFIIFNSPIILMVMLPLSSVILYWRVKGILEKNPGSVKKLDFKALEEENGITDKPMFVKLMIVLLSILLGLLLSPVHNLEPAWLTTMGMFACAMMFEPHKLGKYLGFVEWDTLLFFALLFVLVESLSELGVVRMLSEGILAFIEVFPQDSRMPMAIIIILWVSSLGSAFLESLPYTTTMVYVISNLQRTTIAGVEPSVLVWPLSVGACVGGVGSIMGSSANLVCLAVSSRFGELEEEKVQANDFLKYGLPTMLIIVIFAMIWQLIIFVAAEVVP